MRRAVLAVLSTIASLVVLLSYKTSSGTSIAASTVAVSSAVAGTPSASTSDAGTTTTTTTSPTTTSPTTTAAAAAASTTVTGDAVDTRYGPVQVKITVVNGKVTAADAVVYPTDNPRDQEINSYAVPTLDQEAVAAGTASIDSVSGATYTSTGYISSLQSALDKAGL
jgi:uncharacterized protein with FMN-binding domain